MLPNMVMTAMAALASVASHRKPKNQITARLVAYIAIHRNSGLGKALRTSHGKRVGGHSYSKFEIIAQLCGKRRANDSYDRQKQRNVSSKHRNDLCSYRLVDQKPKRKMKMN